MLEPLGPEVWTASRDVRFPGGVVLPARMTVVRLPSGELLVHSPVRIDEELAQEAARLGPVRHLVGPSLYHHLHLRPWAERFPEARVYGVPGLAEKRSRLRFDEALGDEAPPAWRGVIDQRLVRGMPKLNEMVFLHRPSRTLIVTDMVFNIREPRTFMTGLVLRTMGTHKRLAMSRLWKHSYLRDRSAERASVSEILSWDFDRVTMAHGEPLGPGARDVFAAAVG